MAGSGSNPNPEKDQHSVSPCPVDQAAAVQHHFLIVEDNESDIFLIEEAIRGTNLQPTLHVVKDGEEAIRFVDAVDRDVMKPCPAVMILDINLPKRKGDEVLHHIRKSKRCGNALTIVVSSSDSPRDREEMTKLGANSYFRKPSDYDEFMRLGGVIRKLLASRSRQ